MLLKFISEMVEDLRVFTINEFGILLVMLFVDIGVQSEPVDLVYNPVKEAVVAIFLRLLATNIWDAPDFASEVILGLIDNLSGKVFQF